MPMVGASASEDASASPDPEPDPMYGKIPTLGGEPDPAAPPEAEPNPMAGWMPMVGAPLDPAPPDAEPDPRYGSTPTVGVLSPALHDTQSGMTPIPTPTQPYARCGMKAVFLRDLPWELFRMCAPIRKPHAALFSAVTEPASCATLCQSMTDRAAR